MTMRSFMVHCVLVVCANAHDDVFDDCVYDTLVDPRLFEQVVFSNDSCLNDCSGQGRCTNGSCECVAGVLIALSNDVSRPLCFDLF